MFYSFIRIVARIIVWFWWDVKVTGRENIPKDGPLLIVGNHQSNLDPVAIALQTKREVHFLAKIELVRSKIGRWFFDHLGIIPVNRQEVSPMTMKKSIRILKEGGVVGIFPEGTRVKDPDNRPAPMSGFVTFALREKVPIVPVLIEGPGMRFRSKVRVTIGQPFELLDYYGQRLKGEKLDKLAGEIMDNIYNLQ